MGDAAGAVMWDFLNALFIGPALPGTILLGVCAAYWLLLIAGAVDLDLLDLEVDASPDAEVGGSGWGMTALKFLNINDVPLMIWLTVFAAGYVASSVLIDGSQAQNGFGPVAAAISRNGAIGLVAAKLLTQPLRGRFETIEPNTAETLVGRNCVVTTSEVSDSFGQARVESDGAPLLLNIRGPAGHLHKNDLAVIVAYDRDRSLFLVEPVPVPPVSAAPSEPAHREAV